MNLFLFLYSVFYIFMMMNAAKLISRSRTIKFYCTVLYCILYTVFTQALQADKLAMVEKHKNEMLSIVKATASKLKFTLNGSVARDREYLQMALSSAKERLVDMETVLSDVESVFKRTGNEPVDINVS